MEVLERIMKQVHMTSQGSKNKCFCENCEDTGWILTENNCYRKCPCQERKHLQSLWQNFGVNPKEVKNLNEYEVYDKEKKTERARDNCLNYVMRFPKFFEENLKENWLALLGQPGAGKTHLIIATGALLLKNNYEVVYMPYLEGSKELKDNVGDKEYYNKLCNRYKKCKLLIIDDLFKEKVRNGKLIIGATITEADMKHIYPILNYRYFNNLPMIVSSELTPELLIQLDEALATRILERCKSFLTVFRGDKYNYRMKEYKRGE